MLKKLN